MSSFPPLLLKVDIVIGHYHPIHSDHELSLGVAGHNKDRKVSLFDSLQLFTSRPLVHERKIIFLLVYVTPYTEIMFPTDEMNSESLFFFPQVELITVYTHTQAPLHAVSHLLKPPGILIAYFIFLLNKGTWLAWKTHIPHLTHIHLIISCKLVLEPF